MDIVMGLVVGIGLSAACGFRIFVPLLGMSIAHLAGHLELAEGFAWIGTWPALIAFGSATILEIGAYYIPWLDNVLDGIATPAAIVAGTVITASQLNDLSPLLQWTLAALGGGGTSAIVQVGTVAARTASSVATAGFGNAFVATGEDFAAIMVTFLAVVLPIFCFLAVIWIGYKMLRMIFRTRPPQHPMPAA